MEGDAGRDKGHRHFKNYLLGKRFWSKQIVAAEVQGEPGQAGCWLESMSEYIYDIDHRKGLKHNNSDGLSRRECADCT